MRASEQAYRVLRDEIVHWHLPPGAALAEVDLALRLKMSRTPVREALARLVADGLAVAVGGRGLEVAPLDRAGIRRLYELRQALEVQAARLAAGRRDATVFAELAAQCRAISLAPAGTDPDRVAYYDLVGRLDAAIDAAVDNDYLVAALRSARIHAARVRRAAQDNPARLTAAALEHAAIAEAVAAGDPELAEHTTYLHLHNSLHNALATAATVDAAVSLPA